MRLCALVACGALAACMSGPVGVPSEAIFYEVPRPGAQGPSAQGLGAQGLGAQAPGAGVGPDAFTRRIEDAIGGDGAPAASAMPGAAAPDAAGGATPLDDDLLNLNLYTLEQQRIDAAIAERELEAARRQLVIVRPGTVPREVAGVNIASFAQATTHAVGERRYARSPSPFTSSRSACRRFSSPDEAQRVFLSSGGPERDSLNVDPEGDGFACGWDPEPFRRLGR